MHVAVPCSDNFAAGSLLFVLRNIDLHSAGATVLECLGHGDISGFSTANMSVILPVPLFLPSNKKIAGSSASSTSASPVLAAKVSSAEPTPSQSETSSTIPSQGKFDLRNPPHGDGSIRPTSPASQFSDTQASVKSHKSTIRSSSVMTAKPGMRRSMDNNLNRESESKRWKLFSHHDSFDRSRTLTFRPEGSLPPVPRAPDVLQVSSGTDSDLPCPEFPSTRKAVSAGNLISNFFPIYLSWSSSRQHHKRQPGKKIPWAERYLVLTRFSGIASIHIYRPTTNGDIELERVTLSPSSVICVDEEISKPSGFPCILKVVGAPTFYDASVIMRKKTDSEIATSNPKKASLYIAMSDSETLSSWIRTVKKAAYDVQGSPTSSTAHSWHDHNGSSVTDYYSGEGSITHSSSNKLADESYRESLVITSPSSEISPKSVTATARRRSEALNNSQYFKAKSRNALEPSGHASDGDVESLDDPRLSVRASKNYDFVEDMQTALSNISPDHLYDSPHPEAESNMSELIDQLSLSEPERAVHSSAPPSMGRVAPHHLHLSSSSIEQLDLPVPVDEESDYYDYVTGISSKPAKAHSAPPLRGLGISAPVGYLEKHDQEMVFPLPPKHISKESTADSLPTSEPLTPSSARSRRRSTYGSPPKPPPTSPLPPIPSSKFPLSLDTSPEMMAIPLSTDNSSPNQTSSQGSAVPSPMVYNYPTTPKDSKISLKSVTESKDSLRGQFSAPFRM